MTLSRSPVAPSLKSFITTLELLESKPLGVAIEFEGENQGHALNAFHTTDRGLVWIDSSGSWFEPSTRAKKLNGEADTIDKVAYLAIGREYGLVSLSVTSSPEYAYYEQYMKGKLKDKTMRELYYMMAKERMSEMARYDEWSSAEPRQAFPQATDENAGAREWYEEPKGEEDGRYLLVGSVEGERYSLSPSWGILGTVSSIDVYW